MIGADSNILKSGAAFARKVIAPVAASADETETFPADIFREIGCFGIFGTPYPEQYEGSGLNFATYLDLIGEIARYSAAVAMSTVAHATLACEPIWSAGSEGLKARYLPALLSGVKIGAFAMTESGSGSDISALTTCAEDDGDGFILNGSKLFITNANIADIIVVVAKTSRRAGVMGLSLLLVEKDMPGVLTTGKSEKKLGMRASDTGELVFHDVRIPKTNLIGRKDRGFEVLQRTLSAARLGMAAIAIGLAKAARDLSLDYAVQRRQFGQPLYRFQLVKRMLADMEMKIDAAELLLANGARLRDSGQGYAKQASEAKLFASETAMEVTRDAIQIHGAYGYCRDLPLERLFRDAKLTEIGDGTSEIQRLIIADEMMKERANRLAGLAPEDGQ